MSLIEHPWNYGQGLSFWKQEWPQLKPKPVDHHRPLLRDKQPIPTNAPHRHTVFADLMLRVAEARLPNVVSLPFPKILERKAL
jgi:hypothetical protein